MNKGFMIFVIGIFMISSVYALGVSPARTTLDFSPGMENTVDFQILNSAGKDMNILIAAQGELAEYISVSSGALNVAATEKTKQVSYEFSLPENLGPGLHTADIIILEAPNSADGATSVKATVAVVTQLHIYVPYPGKHANAEMKIVSSKDGGVTFVFPVISVGEFDLTSVKVNVDIYDTAGTKIDSFITSPIEIPSGEKKEIVRAWGVGAPSGDYVARASLIYDEGTQGFNGTFSIGDAGLVLQDIGVNDFKLGEIVKLNMLVENRWNEKIEGAYVYANILNDRGDIVSKFESAAHDIPSKSKENFEAYWDTAGVKVGTYEADIAIKHGEESSKNSLQFKVDENELTIIGLGYVISDGANGGENGLVIILIIVIVVLVLINLLWFLLLRKRLKK